jgi:hypothetical protein
MPCISGNYTPAAGPILQLAVVSIDLLRQAVANPAAMSNPSMYNALLDTGASTTCVSEKVIADLALHPTGKTQMVGATGVKVVDQYGFAIGLMTSAQPTSAGLLTGQLSLLQVQGCVFDNPGMGFDVLLGRDILCQGSFSVTFDGRFLLCF